MAARISDQVFKTTDIFSFFGACLLLIVLLVRIFYGLSENKINLVNNAELLINAYQIWELKEKGLLENSLRQKLEQSESRYISSLGSGEYFSTIGLDFWGQPYHYQVRNNNSNGKSEVLVWSTGPNGMNETLLSTAQFRGDDSGLVFILDGQN